MTISAVTTALPVKNNSTQDYQQLVEHKETIDTILDELKEISDNHFGATPDHTTQEHLFIAKKYATLLTQLSEAAF